MPTLIMHDDYKARIDTIRQYNFKHTFLLNYNLYASQ